MNLSLTKAIRRLKRKHGLTIVFKKSGLRKGEVTIDMFNRAVKIIKQVKRSGYKSA